MYWVAFHKYFLFPNAIPWKLMEKLVGNNERTSSPVHRDIDPIITHKIFSLKDNGTVFKDFPPNLTI